MIQIIAKSLEETESNNTDRSLLLDHEIISVDSDAIEIKLTFNDPLQISEGDEPDLLFIQLELDEFKD